MVWDLGCWGIGTVWVLQGAIWGHLVTCEAKKRSLVSRRRQVGAGSENAVRGVLRELASERWNIRLGGWWPGGATSTTSCRRGAASVTCDRGRDATA